MSYTAKTFCRNCSALCSMEITVEDGRLSSVVADGSVSPYGAYLCAKGLSAVDFHNDTEERLLQSLKRDSAGHFTNIEASLALDEIATQLTALIDRYGPRSVAVYHGTGAYRSVLGAQLEKSFLSVIGSPNLFSTMTIDQSAKWVTAGRMGVMASGKPSFQDVDLGIIVGNNPVVTHQAVPFTAATSGAPGRSFVAARKRGMRLVVIDPRHTETARYADLVIQPLPGEDAVVFAAIAHILLRDGTYNRDFCDRFVTQIGALREAVAPFTPELAARRADIPVEQIEQIAQWIGEARRPFIGSGTGPSMSIHSNLNDHMIEVVNALAGGYKRAGDRVYNPGTLRPRTVMETVLPPGRSWEKGVKCHSADIGKLFGEFPTALLPREITTPGDHRIRALINFGGDPVMALGNPALTVPAFQDLELLISLDARTNETGKLSHYVIATSQPFERHDLSTPGEALYPEAFAQYTAPVVEKPSGTIHDWEFFWEIASRMGRPLTLKYWNYGLDFDAIPEGLPLDLEHKPDAEEMIRFLCKDSRVPFDVLREHRSGVRPEGSPEYVRAAPSDNGARLELCPADIAAELSRLWDEPVNRHFRYRLTSRRTLEALNTAYRDSPRTRKRYPVNWAYLNPEDMTAESIVAGDRIQIQSEFGSIVGIARAEPQLRRGVVSMTHLFGSLTPSDDPFADGGSYTGHLTSLQRYLEPINFMPRFSGIPVNIAAMTRQQDDEKM